MQKQYALGLDFGTNSVRAIILNLVNGKEETSETSLYPGGQQGIYLDKKNPHLARQYPGDYHTALEAAASKAVKKALRKKIRQEDIVGIGVAATGSTPLPIDNKCKPVALKKAFRKNLNAYAWLWKDHTAAEEAAEITELARKKAPEYLKKCGGAYSSEWFWSKIYRCYKIDKKVFEAAHSWVELSDYIPAMLCGVANIDDLKRNICAAGHKGMYNANWGGLPSKKFLQALASPLAELRERLYEEVYAIDKVAGTLSAVWAKKLGLRKGIPVAVGALDAHLGAVGSGAADGVLVKIIGTSTCDIMAVPAKKKVPDIEGVAGIVPDSVLPGYTGIEAGQSAVGDIFNWFVKLFLGKPDSYHNTLTKKAAALRAGESGLLALDWNNGNRNILTDPNLTGLLIGQTLHTEPFEVYRALIEATAFGALRIIEQIEKHGMKIEKVINCGGIAQKNSLFMQIYANVLNRPMEIADSSQTVALGAAIAGGFVALKGEEGFESIESMQQRICNVKRKRFLPDDEEHNIYKELYVYYKILHDSFGLAKSKNNLFKVMKKLIEIKRKVSISS